MAGDDAAQVRSEFGEAVNMTASELEKWLATDESRAAGQHKDGGESTGHEAGRHIVEILRKKQGDLSGSDYDHMRKVHGYVARHLEQKPDRSPEELADMRWTHSLKNWGHDPLK